MPPRAAWFILTLAFVTACRSKNELVVFVAPSLARAVGEIEDSFAQGKPDVRIRTDISGSQVAARKLTELNMRADVLAVADAEVIEQMLVPQHAAWSIRFATNTIVLAHLGHSRFTEEVTSDNWPDILSRPGVRLGIVNPDLAPIGYRTLMVWQLATPHYQRPNLESTLRAQVAKEHVMSDEATLWALLSSRAIDYAFLYRSTAEEHRLKTTPLPAAINLGDPALAEHYATAQVPVVMKGDAGKVVVRGTPLWFALTIPNDAPHRELALDFVTFFLAERGRASLTRAGFTPLLPALATHRAALPAALAPLTAAAQ